jgi:hypothetical protein
MPNNRDAVTDIGKNNYLKYYFIIEVIPKNNKSPSQAQVPKHPEHTIKKL